MLPHGEKVKAGKEVGELVKKWNGIEQRAALAEPGRTSILFFCSS
jgi:hypothetical protein